MGSKVGIEDGDISWADVLLNVSEEDDEGSLTADRGKPMTARAVGSTESTVPIDPSQQSGGSVLLFGTYETMGADEGRNAIVDGSGSEYPMGTDRLRKAMGKTSGRLPIGLRTAAGSGDKGLSEDDSETKTCSSASETAHERHARTELEEHH
ncbi:MAG: hypothetical protein Q9174_003570 [Haloplaca sp. 1 TL-2023]